MAVRPYSLRSTSRHGGLQPTASCIEKTTPQFQDGCQAIQPSVHLSTRRIATHRFRSIEVTYSLTSLGADRAGPELLLAIVRRRLPEDWTARYNITPVLIETLVETPRYTGAVYRASGWIRVGTTQGRGRYDTHMKRAEPRTDIWLRPLRRDWKRTLNR